NNKGVKDYSGKGLQEKSNQNTTPTNPLILKSSNPSNNLASEIVREVFIPALEKEINNGKNFAQLRQIYQSLILAYWFKTKLKDSIVNKVYSDKRKVKGLEGQRVRGAKESQSNDFSNPSNSTLSNPLILNSSAPSSIKSSDPQSEVQQIYQQYLNTFKNGVCNTMKVEYDPYAKKNLPRKYFAGGANLGKYMKVTLESIKSHLIASKTIYKTLKTAVLVSAFTVVLTIAKPATAQTSVDQAALPITEKIQLAPDSVIEENSLRPAHQLISENLSKENVLSKKDSADIEKVFEESPFYTGMKNKKTSKKTMQSFIKLLNDFYNVSQGGYPLEQSKAITHFIKLPFDETNPQKVSFYFKLISQVMKENGYLLGLPDMYFLDGKGVPYLNIWRIISQDKQGEREFYYVDNNEIEEFSGVSMAGVVLGKYSYVVSPFVDELLGKIYDQYTAAYAPNDLIAKQFSGLLTRSKEDFVFMAMGDMAYDLLLYATQADKDFLSGEDFTKLPFKSDILDPNLITSVNRASRAWLTAILRGRFPLWNLGNIQDFFYNNGKIDETDRIIGQIFFPLFTRLRFPLAPENQDALKRIKRFIPAMEAAAEKDRKQDLKKKEKEVRDAALAIAYWFYPNMLTPEEAAQAQLLLKNPKWMEVINQFEIKLGNVEKGSNNMPAPEKKASKTGSSLFEINKSSKEGISASSAKEILPDSSIVEYPSALPKLIQLYKTVTRGKKKNPEGKIFFYGAQDSIKRVLALAEAFPKKQIYIAEKKRYYFKLASLLKETDPEIQKIQPRVHLILRDPSGLDGIIKDGEMDAVFIDGELTWIAENTHPSDYFGGFSREMNRILKKGGVFVANFDQGLTENLSDEKAVAGLEKNGFKNIAPPQESKKIPGKSEKSPGMSFLAFEKVKPISSLIENPQMASSEMKRPADIDGSATSSILDLPVVKQNLDKFRELETLFTSDEVNLEFSRTPSVVSDIFELIFANWEEFKILSELLTPEAMRQAFANDPPALKNALKIIFKDWNISQKTITNLKILLTPEAVSQAFASDSFGFAE
ncbi:MAG: hypothetical protein NT079_02525, partial [Candidatus Omnitrophica bacterium]|nr:hypothetical protein [Candidatus Omnitrophota bacterium]